MYLSKSGNARTRRGRVSQAAARRRETRLTKFWFLFLGNREGRERGLLQPRDKERLVEDGEEEDGDHEEVEDDGARAAGSDRPVAGRDERHLWVVCMAERRRPEGSTGGWRRVRARGTASWLAEGRADL